VEVRGSYILVSWQDVAYGGTKKFKNQWRQNFVSPKRKKITSEGSGVGEIDAMPGIRVEGRTLYWGTIPVGVIASTRGSVIKVLYMCPICGAVYSHARHWRYHLRSKHPEEYREMVEAGRAAIKGYRARLEEQLRGASSATSMSSVVSSVPVSRPSSVPVSRSTSPSVPTFSSGLFELPPPIGPAFRPPSLEELERFMRESEKKGKPPFE